MFSCFHSLRSQSSNSSGGSDASTKERGRKHCRIKGQVRVHEAGQEQAPTVETCASSLSQADLDEAPMIKTYGSLNRISREDLLELKSTLSVTSRHLQSPWSPITENTLQVGLHTIRVEPALPAARASGGATVLDSVLQMPQHSSKIGTLLELAARLLGIDTMAVTLLDGNREVTPAATGFITPEATFQAPGSCRWVLVPTLHHVVIVEDTLADPRTCAHRCVINEPHVRFYCSAPLTESDGHQFGTICALDRKPQRMDPDQQTILCNIAALVSRELGKGRAGQGQQLLQRPRQLRARNSHQEALMVVDVDAPGWRVLHMSQPAADRAGIMSWSRENTTTLLSMFALNNQPAPWTLYAKDAKQRKSFCVKGVCCNSNGTQPMERFDLMFRPAPTDCLKGNQQMHRGASNVAQAHSDTTGSVYFVALCPMGRADGHRARPGSKSSKGALGSERRRSHGDRPMALKVIDEVG